MSVTWLIHVRVMTHPYAWRDSFICVTWLIHMCDVTHSCVSRDAFICVTWLIHMCDVTHSYVWHDSLICVTWLIHMCDMTHWYAWEAMSHIWTSHMNWSCHTCEWVMSRIRFRENTNTSILTSWLTWPMTHSTWLMAHTTCRMTCFRQDTHIHAFWQHDAHDPWLIQHDSLLIQHETWHLFVKIHVHAFWHHDAHDMTHMTHDSFNMTRDLHNMTHGMLSSRYTYIHTELENPWLTRHDSHDMTHPCHRSRDTTHPYVEHDTLHASTHHQNTRNVEWQLGKEAWIKK